MLTFQDSGHLYSSLPGEESINWISVSTLIHSLCPIFDAPVSAAKCTKNSKSKWFKIPVPEILQAWENENKRSTDLGSWYHSVKENELLIFGKNVIAPIIKEGIKYAPKQTLESGIYPEHLMYLQSIGLCGQSDIVEIEDNILTIRDHKTNKEIKKQAFTSSYTGEEKMLSPLSHLGNCNYNHYALQLSLYAYMILKHNPQFKLNKLQVEHVTFEEEGVDKYGYPIAKLVGGEPVVKGVEIIEVPYMKSEVLVLIEYLKKNKNKLIKH